MKTTLTAIKMALGRPAVLALAAGTVLGLASNRLGAQGFGGFGANNLNNRNTTRSSSSSAATYPSSTEMGTATVSVDPETRRVFVVTDDDTAEYVKEVVQNLDRPAPQVLINCIFVEVTHSKGTDIGVEGTYQFNIDAGSDSPLTGASTAATLFDLATTGGIYSFVGDDLQVTLALLAKSGKTEILSRPTILARNNQPATITIGQQVPLITATRYDNYGNQINSITYEDVGIILTVTPFITSDRLVEMVVSPQISQLADRSQWVQISAGSTNAGAVSAPVIDSRAADTVVVVPDGKTVVIGGLIQNLKQTSESKVPILGDIPVLGFFFRHKTTGDAKTELMIFMTPHIVEYPGDLVAITAKERSQTKIVPKAFPEEELNRYLDGTSPAGNVPSKEE